jgi:UDP-N-acetylmuramoyl-L-alanyl-D-glutamate--2,6-diaminopimelate ligase
MQLSHLASHLPQAASEATDGYDVLRVVSDSRRARPGDLFVAVRGLQSDGHDFVAEAAANGAAVAIERPVPLPAGTPLLRLPDTRSALGELAAEIQGRPARRLRMIGVTGSAGKTTTTHMTAHILSSTGLAAGYLSTVAHRAGAESLANRSGQTTMEAPDVQEWLTRMLAAGAGAAVVESSSHALEQGRVNACDFDVAAFTNVGHDHLDYHGTWQNYLAAKAKLIDFCAAAAPKGMPKTAVLNRDDASWEYLKDYGTIDRRLTYGIENPADVRATGLATDGVGIRFRLATESGATDVRLALPARFNVANALCAATCCLAVGISLEQVAAGLATFAGVPGRLERVDVGQPFEVYVDFAHSSLRLSTVLGALRGDTRGRVIVVFGASGRSDHDPVGMGRAAGRHADFFIITSDDPASKDPGDLAREIESGIEDRRHGTDYEVILDRRKAIRHALRMAVPGDVVVLAGKGHERTMLLADGPVPWDERAEAEQALRELGLPQIGESA